jgi:hypothetical protein
MASGKSHLWLWLAIGLAILLGVFYFSANAANANKVTAPSGSQIILYGGS